MRANRLLIEVELVRTVSTSLVGRCILVGLIFGVVPGRLFAAGTTDTLVEWRPLTWGHLLAKPEVRKVHQLCLVTRRLGGWRRRGRRLISEYLQRTLRRL